MSCFPFSATTFDRLRGKQHHNTRRRTGSTPAPCTPGGRRIRPTGVHGDHPPPTVSSSPSLSSSRPPPPNPLAAPSPTTRSGRRRRPATPTSRTGCGDGCAGPRQRRRRTACCAASPRSATTSSTAATRLKKGSWIMSAARNTSTACTNHPLEKAWMALRGPSAIREVSKNKRLPYVQAALLSSPLYGGVQPYPAINVSKHGQSISSSMKSKSIKCENFPKPSKHCCCAS